MHGARGWISQAPGRALKPLDISGEPDASSSVGEGRWAQHKEQGELIVTTALRLVLVGVPILGPAAVFVIIAAADNCPNGLLQQLLQWPLN